MSQDRNVLTTSAQYLKGLITIAIPSSAHYMLDVGLTMYPVQHSHNQF